MEAAINAFSHGFDNFLLSTVVAGILLTVSCVIYVLLTPMKELDLLRQGNASAGLGLCAKIELRFPGWKFNVREAFGG